MHEVAVEYPSHHDSSKSLCWYGECVALALQQRTGEGGSRSGAWPRAAWFVRGQGRHAVVVMSDAPLILPLTLLGDFVPRLGRRPRQDELVTYLARLREQARPHGLEYPWACCRKPCGLNLTICKAG